MEPKCSCIGGRPKHGVSGHELACAIHIRWLNEPVDPQNADRRDTPYPFANTMTKEQSRGIIHRNAEHTEPFETCAQGSCPSIREN